MITLSKETNMRMIILLAAMGITVNGQCDPRPPLADDSIRSATGIMAFTEVPLPASRVHPQFRYDTTAVAPGITTFSEHGSSYAVVQGNITLIVGDKAALVIDSGHFPAVAQRVIADIRKLTDKPVRYLAITHWHFDHYMGNAEFADAFPGISIIAQNFTATMLDKYGPTYVHYRAKIEGNLKPAREMLASGKSPDGAALAPARRELLERVISEAEAAGPEFDLMRYRGADLTFEDGIDIDLGNRIVKLMHLGRGNTAGDLIAYVPDAKVLVTGDTLVYPVPYMFGSYLAEWPVVLQKMADMDVTTVVPGHGPVMRDKTYLVQVRQLLLDVVAEVKRVWKPGMTGDDVRKLVDFSKQRASFCHGDYTNERVFGNSIETAAVDRAVQQLEGKLKPEKFDEPD